MTTAHSADSAKPRCESTLTYGDTVHQCEQDPGHADHHSAGAFCWTMTSTRYDSTRDFMRALRERAS